MAFHPLSLLLPILALFPDLATCTATLPIFGPKPSSVYVNSMLLTDAARSDPFARDGRVRSVMVSSFAPVLECLNKSLDSYMPPATGVFMDKKFSAYGLPEGTFQGITIENCKNSPNTTSRRRSPDPLPLVLFSGALGTSRHLYNSMLQSVASRGFLVVSIDHPYDADIVEFTNGTAIHGVNIESDADVELALETRVSDIRFVYQQLQNCFVAEKIFAGRNYGDKMGKAAVFGHSLGGAAAAAAVSNISSLLGGVNLDGTLFGPVVETGFARPFMLIGHENKTRETDPSWDAIWPRLTSWKREYEVKKTAHYSFSDLPLVASVLGIQGQLPAQVEDIIGTMDGERIMKLSVGYVTAFLDMVLKSKGEKELRRLDKEFSEAVRVG